MTRIVITGASRGIGAGLAAAYREQGAIVTGTSTTGASGLLALDVTDPAAFSGLAGAVGDDPLNLLVCNAGVYLDKGLGIDDLTPEHWAHSFAVNVTGVFLTIRTLLPALLRGQTPGRIAIISSQMASDTRAPGGSYTYRASKAAVLNLGRNLATDLKPEGIAVGIYHPGWVRTDMGGDVADISVAEAVSGLMSEFSDLSMDTTGCFRTWDGRDHPY